MGEIIVGVLLGNLITLLALGVFNIIVKIFD